MTTDAAPATDAPASDNRAVSTDHRRRRAGHRLLADYTKLETRAIGVGTFASLLQVASRVAIPLIARTAIDTAFDPLDDAAILGWCALLAVMAAVTAVGVSIRWYTAFAVAYRTEHRIRTRLLGHLLASDAAFHSGSRVGDLLSRATHDSRQLMLLIVFAPVFVGQVFMVVTIVIVLVILDPLLALVSLAALPLLLLGAAWFQRLLDPGTAALQRQLAEVSGVVEETATGIRVVKGFGTEQHENARLDKAAGGVRTIALELAALRANFIPFLDLLPSLGLAAVLFVGGRAVIDDTVTIGTLVAFNFLLLQLVFPLRMTSWVVAQWSRATAAAARIVEILETRATVTEPASPRALPSGPVEVHLDGLHFSHAAPNPDDSGDEGDSGTNHTLETPVLMGLETRIAAGESVAIVGATGSGKSTLASLLIRLFDPDKGAVRIGGIDVRELSLGELRRAVSLVFEETFLFSDTIASNIAVTGPESSLDDIRRAARLAGADDFITELDDGYETVVGEHGYSLSGGQRQRIAIARAILADPQVLVLDDATSAVDPSKEHEIRDALGTVMAGRTTILIAHRPATISLAERVLVLDEGRIVAEGTHEALLTDNARYREILAEAGSGPDAGADS